jgi:hypothetical protein
MDSRPSVPDNQDEMSLSVRLPSDGQRGDVFAAQSPPSSWPSLAIGAPPSFVYAIGKIEPRFPRLSVEKEFAQAVGREVTTGLTDRQAFVAVLNQPGNRYLARQLCWVMTVQGMETYIVVPRDSVDTDLLVGSLRPNPNPGDLDVVIGTKGPIAPPDLCNGLQVPVVAFDQLYSFGRDELIQGIIQRVKTAAKVLDTARDSEFQAAAEEVFDRILQLADNAGSSDTHRALNYLGVRAPTIYQLAIDQHAQNSRLSAVTIRPSSLSGTRKLLNVIFAFTNRNTDVVEKFYTCVDVTDQFPFLVTKLTPTYDQP